MLVVYSTRNHSLIITNKRATKATLSFDYAIAQNSGTIQVDGAVVTAGGKFSKELAPDASVKVYIKSGTSKTLTFENVPLSALVVWKYDSVTGEAVSNAVFQVKYLTGTSGTGGTVIGTYKTSANGSFTVTGLKEGTYIVCGASSSR